MNSSGNEIETGTPNVSHCFFTSTFSCKNATLISENCWPHRSGAKSKIATNKITGAHPLGRKRRRPVKKSTYGAQISPANELVNKQSSATLCSLVRRPLTSSVTEQAAAKKRQKCRCPLCAKSGYSPPTRELSKLQFRISS